MVAVWAILFTRGPLEATARLDRSRCRESDDPLVQAHVNALGPLLLSMMDRYDEAVKAGQESLARLPTGNAFADGVLRNAMAHVFTVMGENVHARQLIDEARRDTGDSAFSRMYAESVEGMLDLQAGRLRLATARFRAAVRATREFRHNYASGNAWAGMLYASVLYEANELEAAERLVDVYLPMASEVGLPGHMSVGYIIRARIAFSRGDVDRSFEALTDLEYLAHHRRLPRVVTNAKLERARLLALQGNAQAAKEELDRANDPALESRLQRQRLSASEIDYPALARVRWILHFGDARSVLPWLEQELANSVEQQRHRRALRLRVLHSLALARSGDPTSAAKSMATAVRQAAHEGFVRVITDEGPEVGLIVRRLHAMQELMPVSNSDPGLMLYMDRLLGAFGALPKEPAASADVPEVVERLTRKEIQVLQLAADGYSNAAMAEKLGASDSTVRTHLRSINAKLGAHSRTEAVVIGRRLGVIR
jgi:LuxR family maltose regulon positive regulatory protein